MKSLPPVSVIHWKRLDLVGNEESRIERTIDGWRLSGDVVIDDAETVASLKYEITCDPSLRTRSARVDGVAGGRPVRVFLAADGAGNWIADGIARPELADAVDVDLEFSPATNILPIHRLSMAVGETRRVTSAWLRFPSMSLERLEQTYTREDELVFRYRALVDGETFTARLDTDAFGRVVKYEGLWIATSAEPDS